MEKIWITHTESDVFIILIFMILSTGIAGITTRSTTLPGIIRHGRWDGDTVAGTVHITVGDGPITAPGTVPTIPGMDGEIHIIHGMEITDMAGITETTDITQIPVTVKEDQREPTLCTERILREETPQVLPQTTVEEVKAELQGQMKTLFIQHAATVQLRV